ncbi:phosphotransferase system HPr-like phosphotransfer protein [Sedimentibacter acidaminivorans]|uniref:Phosphotransferase system HPr-like phosphotransfer protein n=1 Tax=Sedimentibacter acidaminivorans TaxID=913099 RepID=A0ABS4GFE8_9FIRM|nr:S-layer homology domain-containing protein [Sedimentibacter acidaminivorans]MBP1926425.1 phosphotransferase system HPr-like phosphotransfer protein [Sedimentibacter acidaminivorans]
MKNKIFTRVLLFTVLLSMVFMSAASAVTFSDISDHWAKDYIIKVANNGIVTGYSDGKFKPENSVTVLESLVMMSRLYDIDDDIKEQIVEEYEPVLEDMTNAEDYTWAFENLSLALEFGIVSRSGLEKMFKDETISQKASKEEICVLLTKAMMLSDELKKVFVLPFNDALQISELAKPYMYIMYDKGIIAGDTKKNVNPKDNITRAVMATMLDRAYEYIDENSIEPEIKSYKPTTVLNGIISDVTVGDVESYIYVKDDNSDTTIVRVNSSTKIYLNDKTVEISKIEKGILVKCEIDEQRIARTMKADSLTKIIKGKISYVAYASPAKITIIDEDNDKITYSVPSDDMKIYLDGKETALKNLEEKDLISLRIKDDVLYRIDSISRIQKYEGKITAIDYTNLPIKLTMLTTQNNKSMTFEYSSDVEVTRNDDDSSFDQIRIGDIVTLTAEYGEMILINTNAADAELSGTIKEILIANQNKIKIANSSGTIKEYPVSNNVQINIGSKNATIYDLRLGYQVNVNTSGDEIVTIEAAEIQTAKSFSGKVVFVNIDDKLIMMQNIKDNGQTELVYVRVSNSTKIFDTSGSTKYIKNISEGNNIMCTIISQGGENVAVSIMIQ